MVFWLTALAFVLMSAAFIHGLTLYQRDHEFPGGDVATNNLTVETSIARAAWWSKARVVAIPLSAQDVYQSVKRLSIRVFGRFTKSAKERRLEKMAKQIRRHRIKDVVSNDIVLRQAESAAIGLHPSYERLITLARTPNATLAAEPNLLVELGQHVHALEKAGIPTDGIIASETPPLGFLGRVGAAAGAAVGVTPYGRIWTAFKIGVRVLPWLISGLFFGFWQGARADGARQATKVDSLRATNASLITALVASQSANKALVARVEQSDDLARRQSEAVQNAQDQAARNQAAGARRAAQRANLERKSKAAVEDINAKKDIANDNPLVFDGANWVRQRSARASDLGAAAAPPLSGVQDPSGADTGTRVLPDGQ